MDTGCCLEDLPESMDDRDEWRERELRKSVLAAQHDDSLDILFYEEIILEMLILFDFWIK